MGNGKNYFNSNLFKCIRACFSRKKVNSYDKIIIKMLDYGVKMSREGRAITSNEMERYLQDVCKFEIDKISLILALYWSENFKFNKDEGANTKHILSSTGYFRYLQYLDMQNARKNSLAAWIFSSISILIAVSSLLYSSLNTSDVNIEGINEEVTKEILVSPKKIDSLFNVVIHEVDSINKFSDTILERLDTISNKINANL